MLSKSGFTTRFSGLFIKERYEEAQQESYEDMKDEFKSGRALAYWEMNEMINTRLKMLKED